MQPRVKLTRSQAPSTKKEQNMYDNVVDERQKKKPKIETHELTRTADKRKNICKVDSTSWNYESYSTTQAIHHTNPIQRMKYLPEVCYGSPVEENFINNGTQRSYEKIEFVYINGYFFYFPSTFKTKTDALMLQVI